MRHQLLEHFAISYFNGSVRPNLAEKNPMNGRDIEYLMDGPEFDRIKRQEVWSYSNAVGTGYQYRVTYRDKRFSDLDRMLQTYSGTAEASDEEKSVVEQRLYEQVLLMIREGRLPKDFKIRSTKEAQDDRVIAMVEEFGRALDDLGIRVRRLEEEVKSKVEPSAPPDPQSLGPRPEADAGQEKVRQES